MNAIESLERTLSSLPRRQQTLLVAIDGRGGCGKSTLAEELKQRLTNVSIVHLDDFAYPMGGADRQRLLEQIIVPLEHDRPARYQRFDWNTQELAEWHEIQPGGIVIVEGVITLHDTLYRHYDYRIWIECPPEVGFQRGAARDLARDGEDNSRTWLEQWMPEEKKAIEEQKPQDKADIVLDYTQI